MSVNQVLNLLKAYLKKTPTIYFYNENQKGMAKHAFLF